MSSDLFSASEPNEQPYLYRATINIDYSGTTTNEYQYLISALIQAGWIYLETSALQLITHDRKDIWRGLTLVAKQDAAIVDKLSALTIHVQGSKDFNEGVPYPYSDSHPSALKSVEDKPNPGESKKTPEM